MSPQGEPIVMRWPAPVDGAAVLRCAPADTWLGDGLVYGDCGLAPAEVIDRVQDGIYRVLLVQVGHEPAAVVVLEIATCGAPPKKTLSVIAAGGLRMHAWLGHVQRALREIAAGQECERVVVLGRPGWERALRQFGWKKQGVVMQAEPKNYEH